MTEEKKVKLSDLPIEEAARIVLAAVIELDQAASLERAKLMPRAEDGLEIHLVRSGGLARLAGLAAHVLSRWEVKGEAPAPAQSSIVVTG